MQALFWQVSAVAYFCILHTAANGTIDCMSVESVESANTHGAVTPPVNCPSAHPTMTSCGYRTVDSADSSFGGSKMSTGVASNTCTAINEEEGAGIIAVARCCAFSQALELNCYVFDATQSSTNDNDDSSVTCNTAAGWDLLGCQGFTTAPGFDGVWPGATHPQNQGLIASVLSSVSNPGKCTAEHASVSGTSPSEATTGNANCCVAQGLGIECNAYFQAQGETHPFACPAGESMMSCMGTHTDYACNAMYINDLDQCITTARTGTSGIFASAICCSEVTAAPTSTPTENPTTSEPTASTGSPTGSTSMPSVSPTAAPSQETPSPTEATPSPTAGPTRTRAPTSEPSSDPTSGPTSDPSFAPTADPSTSPTNIPSTSASPTSAPTAPPSTLPTPSPLPTPFPTMPNGRTQPPAASPVAQGGAGGRLEEGDQKEREQWEIVAIVLGVLFGCLLLAICLFCCHKRRKQADEVNRANDVDVGYAAVAPPNPAGEGDDGDVAAELVQEGIVAGTAGGSTATNAVANMSTSAITQGGTDASQGYVATSGNAVASSVSPRVSGRAGGRASVGIDGMSDDDDMKSDVFSVDM